MRSTLKDVSIVVVTYKGDDILRNCLDSLSATCGDEPQIVVVDNSPSESTRLLVATYPNTVYVSSPGNPGFAGGNNRAIPECDRPFVLLLNNDTIVHSRDSITQLLDFFDTHPNCGAAQGSAVLRDGKRLAGCGSFLMPIGVLWSPGFNVLEEPTHNTTHQCFTVGGFFLMFRRSILPKVGGWLFRSHFWCYYEGADFCHRVWLSGHEVWFVKTAHPITHLCGASGKHFSRPDIMARYLRNILFSLSVSLSFWSRMRILPRLVLLLTCHSLFHLAKGHLATFRSDLSALSAAMKDIPRIKAARRGIAKLRKVSDKEIFSKVMRYPPLREMIKYVKSNA